MHILLFFYQSLFISNSNQLRNHHAQCFCSVPVADLIGNQSGHSFLLNKQPLKNYMKRIPYSETRRVTEVHGLLNFFFNQAEILQ